MLTSQGLVLATAVAVSAGTVILFDLFKEKCFLNFQIPLNPAANKSALKSCLASSGSKKRDVQKKKKRVKFADNVDFSAKNSEMYRKERRNLSKMQKISCGKEMIGMQIKMPANRMALYSGMLKDRVQRIMEFSH